MWNNALFGNTSLCRHHRETANMNDLWVQFNQFLKAKDTKTGNQAANNGPSMVSLLSKQTAQPAQINEPMPWVQWQSHNC